MGSLIQFALLVLAVIGVSSALLVQRPSEVGTSSQHVKLAAIGQSSSPWGSRGVPSKTARESAFNVEWEPMTELERRLEDGLNYDHIPTPPSSFNPSREPKSHSERSESIPSTRGVFAGYRFTQEEYDRLKSADPTQ